MRLAREKSKSPCPPKKYFQTYTYVFFLLIYFFKYIFSKLLTSHFLIMCSYDYELTSFAYVKDWLELNHMKSQHMYIDDGFCLFFLHFRNI